MSKLIDHSGDVFGNLLVVRRAQTQGPKTMWEYVCLPCGTTLIVGGTHLRLRGVSSCKSCASKQMWEVRRPNLLKRKKDLLDKEISEGRIPAPSAGTVLIPVITRDVIRAAIVDEEDSHLVEDKTWHYWGGYATTRAKKAEKGYRPLSMHRLIAYTHNMITELHPGKSGIEIDHKNRLTLDNRASNLRSTDLGNQSINRGKNTNNTSGYKGVSLTRSGKWVACIGYRGKKMRLGIFETKKEASMAYEKMAKELFDVPEGDK